MLEEYLPFSVLQSNTIFIDSTIYPGCWHSPSHLPISDICGFGHGPIPSATLHSGHIGESLIPLLFRLP